ncbi:MAG: hypothetical protein IKT42_01920 [Clostridia bacterium]|nr:hypothetical protein [Clostridia bacterium]
MRDENQKESITVDMIEKDIKTLCKYSIIYDLVILGIFMFLLLPIFQFIVISVVITTLIVLLFLFGLFVYGCDMLFHLKLFVNMKKKNYNIETDTVVDKKNTAGEYYYPFKPKVNALFFDTPNIFYFSKYKKHRIPKGKSYSFSQSYCMNSDGIYRSTNIGDEFYLIVLNKKILQIYNKKFFDIK